MRRMVSDTRSAVRARIGSDDKNSQKKAINGKDTGSGTSGKANVASGTRLGREAPVSAQSTPQGIRKSKRLENEATASTSSPLKKSERLEKRRTPSPSPLSKSDKGTRALPSNSSGRKQTAKELSFSEEKTNKEMKRKDVMDVYKESEKVESREEAVKKRKKITGAYFKAKYSNKQQIRVPDIEVDETPVRDGLPDSRTGHSSRETLFDNRRLTTNSSSAMNADSLDSESSSSLPRPQDGTAHSEIGEKCTEPKAREGVKKLSSSNSFIDISRVMHGCERLSLADTTVGIVNQQPPGWDGTNDYLTSPTVNMLPTNTSPIKNLDSLEKANSTCTEILQDISENGEKPGHPEAPGMTPSPDSEDINHSGNCLLCSKGKRVGAYLTENDLCSCGGTEREGLGQYSSWKDGGRDEPATASKPVENCSSGDRVESHSDSVMDGRENVIANRSKSGKFLSSSAVKNSKKSLHPIADGGTYRFLEYWVPVQISFYQLELYCDALLSNSIHLCSCEKRDINGALRETLLSVRKCCDHPYLLDISLQNRLINEEKCEAPVVLDVAIRASAKLEVLDMMLTEIKSRGSQVLILVQLLHASGKDMASNVCILEEFLVKRFGQDSYERIDATSKKQAVVDRFNKKENGVFILLLDKGACCSSIKLQSVDNIIIYGSDWNPSNDMKTLQKLSYDSKLVQVKVFRLYSSYTIEERALILAKKNIDFSFSLQSTNRAIVDNLLMWGASHLFSRLTDFHVKYSSLLNVSSQHLFLSELMEEFRSVLGGSYDNRDGKLLISRANKLDVAGYKTNVPLLGETEITVKEGEEPHLFWKNVLELKKLPHWKFLGEPSPRNRKRVEADTNNGYVGNKRRKAGIENRNPAAVQVEPNEHQEAQVADAGRASYLKLNRSSNVSEGKDLESVERTALAVDHNGFHNSLQAELLKLCDVLEYSENVTNTALKLLEYFTKNYRIGSDSPQAFVQAFQISLCWFAALDSKIKVDEEGSLMMAKHHLNYQCSEVETRNVYEKMRSVWINRESFNGDEGVVQPKEIGEKSDEEHVEIRGDCHKVDDEIVKLHKKCSKRQKKLARKQQKEIQEFHQIWGDKKKKLETDYELQLAFSRTLYEGSIRVEKLRLLEDTYAKKVKEHDFLRDGELNNLEAKHLAAMNEEIEKAEKWLAEAKACSSEPKENVLHNKIEALASENLAAEPQNQDQLVEQNQPRSLLEVPEAEPTEAVIDVQANRGLQEDEPEAGKLHDGEPEEGDILGNDLPTMENHEEPEEGKIHEGGPGGGKMLEKELLAVDNQSTVQVTESLSVAIVNPVENPEGNARVSEGQDISEVQVETLDPVDSPTNSPTSKPDDSPTNAPTSKPVNSQTNALSDVEPQERVPPAVEKESTFDVANPDVVDTVDPVQPILEQVQVHSDGPINQTQITCPVECPISEAVNSAIPLQLSVEIPDVMNSEQMDCASPSCSHLGADHLRSDQIVNSSQTAEVAETVILSHAPISQAENFDFRTSIHGPTIELPTSERNDATSQAGIGAAELSSEAVLQSGINASHHSRTVLPLHPTTHQGHPWTTQSLLVNPIRYEVDRLNREKINLEKNHADMAARLNCDCEREIEEITNQIKLNYAKKLQESEAEFAQRKAGFEKNIELAHMNLKLAENFSEKCLDRSPGIPGYQQGTSSGTHVQQMQQSSMQPRLPASASSFPRSPGHLIANTVQPSLSHANPVQPFPSHLNASRIEQRAMPRVPLSHPMRPSPSTSHSVMLPPVQVVQQRTTAPLIATPSRPPVINSITPRNPRITGEIRCQAPHLQSSRPAHVPIAPTTTSPSISQYQPVLPSSQPLALPLSLNGNASSNVAEDLVCLSDDD